MHLSSKLCLLNLACSEVCAQCVKESYIKELVHECLVWMKIFPRQLAVLGVIMIQKIFWHFWRGAALAVVHEVKPQGTFLSWQQATWSNIKSKSLPELLCIYTRITSAWYIIRLTMAFLPLNLSCKLAISFVYRLTRLTATVVSDSSQGEQRGLLCSREEKKRTKYSLCVVRLWTLMQHYE